MSTSSRAPRSTTPPPRPADERPLRVTCGPGLAPYLAQELTTLGYEPRTTEHAGVEIVGTGQDVMRLNLQLRTALRVLQPLAAFDCADPDELYTRTAEIPWERLVSVDEYLTVTSHVSTPTIDNTMFANLRVKDAIVDRISRRHGRRPDAGPARDHVVVHLYWSGRRAVVSLDLSGEKLADRGYRRRPHTAPMQETLAAAVLLALGYDGRAPLVLPMCGSGTLAIEAALIATQRPPGLLRANYGFMHLLDFDAEAWRRLRRETRGRGRRRPVPAPIIATDLDPAAVEAAQANAVTAGVEHLIEFGTGDFAVTPVPDPDPGGGLVVMNPEYGLRLGDPEALAGTYARIGDFLKQRCAGYTGGIFTGSRELAKKIGLRTTRRLPFMHAGIECRLLVYEMWEGGTD